MDAVSLINGGLRVAGGAVLRGGGLGGGAVWFGVPCAFANRGPRCGGARGAGRAAPPTAATDDRDFPVEPKLHAKTPSRMRVQ